jgi:hypothetical protein
MHQRAGKIAEGMVPDHLAYNCRAKAPRSTAIVAVTKWVTDACRGTEASTGRACARDLKRC